MDLTISTFNLHGINQGQSMLKDLCSTSDVVFIQEHWLLPDGLVSLNNIDVNMYCVATSAMEHTISHGILRGRPFGGVAIFVRNNLVRDMRVLVKSERLIAIRIGQLVFTTVYFPTVGNAEYEDVVLELIGLLEEIHNDNANCQFVLGGDFNLEFHSGKSRCAVFDQCLQRLNLFSCDDKISDLPRFTYVHVTNGVRSFIDHFFVSSSVMPRVKSAVIIDSGANLSDHLPLSVCLADCTLSAYRSGREAGHCQVTHKRLRWDKADLASYYQATNFYLSHVDVNKIFKCDTGCSCPGSLPIDDIYVDIVNCLTAASDECCPKTSSSFFKQYWDSELNDLKARYIGAHDLWIACGQPVTGLVFEEKKEVSQGAIQTCHQKGKKLRLTISSPTL